MSRATLLAIACVVVGSTSAFAPVVTPAATASSSNNAATTATATFLVPEQGRQLAAFSQDYHLSKKAKEGAGRASNLASSTRRRQGRATDSPSSPRQGAAGVASAAKSLVIRLLGHDGEEGPSLRGHRCETRASLEEELMNAYPKDPVCHPEDEAIFRQIVN